MLTVLSLFDGMSCGAIALHELGVPVKYYASEIDQHAIKQTKLNFPDTVHLGDVSNWRTWDLDWSSIDLVLAGSPCQGFSFAGKQLAFDDPRSKLFFVFVEILNHIKKFNPDVKFLLENVNMKKNHLRVISEYVGVFPVNINSNLVSAQNRDRWYWTNIRTKKVGLFDELYVDVPQPNDKGILLKDILQPEDEIDEKYLISNKAIERIIRRKWSDPQIEPDKTSCIGTTNNSGRLGIDKGTTLIKVDINGIPKDDQNKASCFTAGAHSGGNHSDMDIICVAMRGRNPENPSDRTIGSPTEQRLEPKTDGKTNCLTSVAKDNLIMKIGNIYPSGGENGNVYSTDGKSPTIKSGETSNEKNGGIGSSNSPKITDGYKLRRLTPTECARLQTIPDWYKWECSNTQIYRMCGNGWTVQVIMHIISFGNFLNQ